VSLAEYQTLVASTGCALIGQTPELAPADKKLYSLRDVTATVACHPLICASIMSKKLAEGIDALVLDVKCGGGAFMKTEAEARELAGMMVAIGNAMGKPTRALLTRMDEPLGHAVGNAVEVTESIACLRGAGPADLMEVTFALGVEMLLLAGAARDEAEARARLASVIADGSALEKFREIVTAQGGDARVVDAPDDVMRPARLRREVRTVSDGYVQSVAALDVALAALHLGAGRTRAEDPVDHAVGFTCLIKVGARVTRGDLLAVIHANDETKAEQTHQKLLHAIVIGENTPPRLPLVLGLVS
jgi:pyrimidine-nucleoside phosphorylase